MTDDEADKLFDFILSRLESKLGRLILANFRQLSAVIKDLVDNNGQLAGNVAILQNQDDLEAILLQAYKDGIEEGVRFTRRDLELPEEEDEQSYEELLALLLLWRQNQARVQAERITQTTIKIYEKVIERGRSQGLTGKNLTSFMLREMNRLNSGRISGISTTEVGEAISHGSEEMARLFSGTRTQPGLLDLNKPFIIQDNTLKKRWRSQRDSIVRDTHRSADIRYTETPISLDDNFQVGIGSAPFPRSSQLPIQERAGCRCYVRYVKPNNS
ncbi:MAG: hypothetical protein NE327_04150 [Lentisphaeraceae bacterium]|nr:hypothetical protein [Lentisphaeraceae bacterium]